MSRTLLRSGGAYQIEPDVLRDRRTSKQASIGVPFHIAEAEGRPVYPLEGQDTFYDHLEAKLLVPSEASGQEPRLVLSERVWVRAPLSDKPMGYGVIGLFTHTAKMATISWSLAAGAPAWGGTCHAARETPIWRSRPADYICASCYALEGNYRYPNNIFFRSVRRHWTVNLLEQDMTGALLASALGDAFEAYARYANQPTCRRKTNAGRTVREMTELGVWDGHQLVVPARTRSRGLFYVPGPPTPLRDGTFEWSSSTAFFESQVPKEGDVVGFFRLHDSGDFSIDPRVELWSAYIRAWGLVMERFPGVTFWAPTRLHVPGTEEVLKNLVALQAEHSNFVLRPSSLFIDNPAPMRVGLAAGSTVERREGSENSKVVDEVGGSCWACPAYPGGSRKAEGSCRDHACRTCWIRGRQAVAYGHH